MSGSSFSTSASAHFPLSVICVIFVNVLIVIVTGIILICRNTAKFNYWQLLGLGSWGLFIRTRNKYWDSPSAPSWLTNNNYLLFKIISKTRSLFLLRSRTSSLFWGYNSQLFVLLKLNLQRDTVSGGAWGVSPCLRLISPRYCCSHLSNKNINKSQTITPGQHYTRPDHRTIHQSYLVPQWLGQFRASGLWRLRSWDPDYFTPLLPSTASLLTTNFLLTLPSILFQGSTN